MGYHRCICPKFVNQQLAQLDMLHEAQITSGCHVVELPILKNLFFPSSIRYWNSLDYIIRNLDSLSLFKRCIKDKYGYKRPPPHYYSGSRAASIWHTCLRLGMSQLSAHLFPFGFVESPRCSCGVTHETVSHYLLDCPLYAAQRERLLVAIRNVIAPTLHPATLPILDKAAYIKILLFGSKDLSLEENILLFRATQNIILILIDLVYIIIYYN